MRIGSGAGHDFHRLTPKTLPSPPNAPRETLLPIQSNPSQSKPIITPIALFCCCCGARFVQYCTVLYRAFGHDLSTRHAVTLKSVFLYEYSNRFPPVSIGSLLSPLDTFPTNLALHSETYIDMERSWVGLFWEATLILALINSIIFAIFVFAFFPSQWSPYRQDLIQEDNFSEEDKKNNESGYGYFSRGHGGTKTLKYETSVTILVLGDIGRSPRMQYHAASIAKHGGRVSLVGYIETDVLPELRASKFVRIIPLKPVPSRLRPASKLLFPFVAPFKVLFQLWSIWDACGYLTKPTKWMLVQNPPSIPTLLIAQVLCFVRNTKLIIDWHNFGHSILALKLGQRHPLVKVAELYEQYVARCADAHFCVTNAMARVLKKSYGIDAMPLHDRPAKQFQPLSQSQRSEVLHRLEGTAHDAKHIEHKHTRLIVSSTSWTADEDFSILLDALVAYSATVSMDKRFPRILAIITGKGPLKDYYLDQVAKLKAEKRLVNVNIKTAWLSTDDYAALLGAADLGVSLHTSSSGVDLPMKVVDMFGTGLPVVGYNKFEAWPELVQEGVNGLGFEKADELEALLEKLFGGNGTRLEKLRDGALKECSRRWDEEWFPVAGKLFKMGEAKSGDAAPAPATQEKSAKAVENDEKQAPVEKVAAPSTGKADPEGQPQPTTETAPVVSQEEA